MAPSKRKTVTTIAAIDRVHSKGVVEDELDEHDPDAAEMDEDGEEEVEESEKDKLIRQEKECKAARTKELKAMDMATLKKLAESKGLVTGKKEDMLNLLIKSEAKERSDKRAHEEKIRAVVQNKSEELESLSIADLKLRANLKGRVSKTECIPHLLKTWQDDGGVDKALAEVDKALAEVAKNEHWKELAAKDNIALLKHCDKNGIDPYNLEAMVDRILEYETRHEKYAPPAPLKDEKPIESIKKGGDLVEALLAREAGRMREIELKKAKEAADMAKVKELNALSLEGLKKLLISKGREADGKKTDLVKAAFTLASEEEAIEAKRNELKSMGAKELKQLLATNGLESNGKVSDMVDTLLKYQLRIQEEFRAYEAKVKELTEQKKDEFDGMPLNELKQLLVAKGLKPGVVKADRVQRLAEEAQKDGSITKKISQLTRIERKAELLAMDKSAVLDLCHELEIDPVLKDVMVQRIISHETDLAEGFVEPHLKKQKTVKK